MQTGKSKSLYFNINIVGGNQHPHLSRRQMPRFPLIDMWSEYSGQKGTFFCYLKNPWSKTFHNNCILYDLPYQGSPYFNTI